MNLYAKLAIAAAAVLVVAVIGMNMLPAGGRVGGGPAATPNAHTDATAESAAVACGRLSPRWRTRHRPAFDGP